MSNVEILEVSLENYETAYVKAIVEDMVLTHRQTRFEPDEYGPAVCYALVNLSDVAEHISDIGSGIYMENPIEAVREYIEAINYDLEWEIIDEEDY
jgi:hypothetical protein